MTTQQLKQIPSSIAAILQGLRLYPGEHPQVMRQLENAIQTMQPYLVDEQKVILGMVDDTLMINDLPYMDALPAVEDLRKRFMEKQIQAIEISSGLNPAHLLCLCQGLNAKGDMDFSAALAQAGARSIKVTMQDDDDNPRAIYDQALQVVESLFQDVRMGQTPSSSLARQTVKEMVGSALAEPYALLAMSSLKDYDNYTFTHSVNVSVIAVTVGRACGVSEAELNILGLGGMLHDLGKMTIDHQIINKPGQLSTIEMEEMKRHPGNGTEIVARMDDIPEEVLDIVHGHHLRYDRTGYPADSRGRKISHLADMVSIADIYDAMTTVRCYQQPLSPMQAVKRMQSLKGSVLHADYVDKFINFLGPYPVGSLVRLQDGYIGFVADKGKQGPGSLDLKLVLDPKGAAIEPAYEKTLADNSQIVAEVDPILKGINLDALL